MVRQLLVTLAFVLMAGTGYAEDKALEIVLPKAENVRKLVKGVLEVAAYLPKGSILHLAPNTQPVLYDFRNSDGVPQRSTNGFFPNVKVVLVPGDTYSSEELSMLNNIEGGLFLTATLQPNATPEGDFAAVSMSQPEADYLKSFEPSGKPLATFTRWTQPRFGSQLNRVINPSDLTEHERVKWAAIFQELVNAVDRTKVTPKSYLYISQAEADQLSVAYERNGLVHTLGAWTIAVKSSAVRHGFPNVPCAEFVSEIVKQAYKRAGYDVFEDFNDDKGNRLIWSETAAVVNLATALAKAGWIPWDMSVYKPKTGAPMMHERATSPGHTYMNAGHDGRIIVDNGAPSGRDLRKTSDKILKLMYQGGIFFLPPGMIPEKW